MKTILKFATFQLTLLLFASFISCTSTQSKSHTLDTISLKEGTLVAPARFGGKWGVITSSGEWVSPPTSDITALREFHEGLALACYKGEKWGYINPYGEWIIKPKFEFNESEYEPSDYTNFNDGRALLKETGKDYGYIDTSGEYVIEPQYEWASPFNEGVAAFLHRKNNIFYEFIDPNGKILLIIEDQNSFEIVSEFSENLISKENDNGKMGFIDITGKWIIPPIYQTTFPFKEGLAYVETINGNGFINKIGEKVIDIGFNTSIEFNEGYAVVQSIENNKHGVIDKSGNLIIPFKYDRLSYFYEGIACYELKDKLGFIDTTGIEINTPIFEFDSTFKNGLAPVYINGRCGVINVKGDLVIDAKYDCIRSFIEIK